MSVDGNANAARLESALVTAIRLSADQSQAAFRVLVETTASPGKVVAFEPLGGHAVHPVLVPVVTLVDVNTTVGVIDDEDPAAVELTGRALSRVTGARWTSEVSDAGVVVALRGPDPRHLHTIRVGSPEVPEDGAKLFVAVQSIGSHGDGIAVTTRGPGAASGRTFTVSGLSGETLEVLGRLTRRFPAGVDAWLVADDGACVAIPRSNAISLAEVA